MAASSRPTVIIEDQYDMPWLQEGICLYPDIRIRQWRFGWLCPCDAVVVGVSTVNSLSLAITEPCFELWLPRGETDHSRLDQVSRARDRGGDPVSRCRESVVLAGSCDDCIIAFERGVLKASNTTVSSARERAISMGI